MIENNSNFYRFIFEYLIYGNIKKKGDNVRCW